MTNDFTFVDFTPKGRGNAVPKGKIRIHNKPGNRRVSLNMDMSQYLKSSGLLKVRGATNNLTGEIYLVFTKDNGAAVSTNGGSQSSLAISNCACVEFLCKNFNITAERTELCVTENLSRTNESATYRVTATTTKKI